MNILFFSRFVVIVEERAQPLAAVILSVSGVSTCLVELRIIANLCLKGPINRSAIAILKLNRTTNTSVMKNVVYA